MILRISFLISLFLLMANAGIADDEGVAAGVWRGDSVCVQKNTACHDEVAVYRVSAIPGKHGHVYVSGGKIVDGKEVVMGSGEWRYNPNTHTLSTELPSGSIALVVEGDEMKGTFTLHDGTVLRQIMLKRE
jgi:hypothetical protein